MAVGIHDAAAAPADNLRQAGDLVGTVQVPGIIVPGKHHVAVDEVAVSLDGDVADGGLPLLVVIGVGGEVERHALFIQGHPGQGHVAFPADQAGHGAPGSLGDGEVVPVGISPDYPLGSGGLELAVDRQLPLGGEDQIRIVECGGDGVPLADADAHPGSRRPGGLGQAIRLRSGDQDGVVVVALPVLAALRGAAAHGEAEGHAIGIAGDEQLGEDDQFGAVSGGLGDKIHGLVGTGNLVKQNGGGLDHGDGAGGLEILHDGSFPGVRRGADRPTGIRPDGTGFLLSYRISHPGARANRQKTLGLMETLCPCRNSRRPQQQNKFYSK